MEDLTWYFVMAAELKSSYALSASDLPPSRTTYPASVMKHVAFQYDVCTGKVFGIEDFTTDSITLEECDKDDFKYIVIAPLLQNEMAIFGELDKFVTVSETRFSQLYQSNDNSYVTVTGVPSEVVKVTLYDGKTTIPVDCVIGDSGWAKLELSSKPTCV